MPLLETRPGAGGDFRPSCSHSRFCFAGVTSARPSASNGQQKGSMGREEVAMFRRQGWLLALALLGAGGWIVGARAGAQRAPAAPGAAGGGGTQPAPGAQGAGAPAPAAANE